MRLSWAVNSLDVTLFGILDHWCKFAALARLRYPVSYGSQKKPRVDFLTEWCVILGYQYFTLKHRVMGLL